MREFLVVYCKGFSMGAADVVPGVSGATIALILGIYDRLLRAITAIDPRGFGSAVRHQKSGSRAALRAELERIDAAFLVALGLGVGTAIVTLSSVLHTAVSEYPVPTYGFFFGLIGMSAIVLYGEIERWTPHRIVLSIAGIALAAAVTGVTRTGTSHDPPLIVLAGAVAVCAMILPGVSGAFFLLLLGQYEYITGTVSAFVDALFGVLDGGALTPLLETGTVIGLFLLGAAVGLVTMAHAVRRSLDRYRATTLAFLVSLMVGALRLPIAESTANLGPKTEERPLAAVVAAIVGAIVVAVVARYTVDLEYDDDSSH